MNHPKISNRDVDMTATDLFRSRILGPLRILLEQSPGLTALILPNVTDLLSNHAVFPQPPFPIAQTLQSDVSGVYYRVIGADQLECSA